VKPYFSQESIITVSGTKNITINLSYITADNRPIKKNVRSSWYQITSVSDNKLLDNIVFSDINILQY
jgi:hypothetical protein